MMYVASYSSQLVFSPFGTLLHYIVFHSSLYLSSALQSPFGEHPLQNDSIYPDRSLSIIEIVL